MGPGCPGTEATRAIRPFADGPYNIVALPCVQPQPMVTRLQDYNGPLKKVVGLFTQQLERKSVHPMRYKPGLKLCSLELKDNFSCSS